MTNVCADPYENFPLFLGRTFGRATKEGSKFLTCINCRQFGHRFRECPKLCGQGTNKKKPVIMFIQNFGTLFLS